MTFGQFSTFTGVFWVSTSPFWAVIFVGVVISFWQRLPNAPKIENRPSGALNSKLVIGCVGDRFEAAVRDAFFDVGVAVEDQLDVVGLQKELGVGERRATMGHEISRAL